MLWRRSTRDKNLSAAPGLAEIALIGAYKKTGGEIQFSSRVEVLGYGSKNFSEP
jgi:hypothetical protein